STRRCGRKLVRAAGAAAAAGVLVGRLALGDLEGVGAAARGDDVRVVDLEPGLLNRVHEVDFGALEVGGAERIDDHVDAVEADLLVALLRAAVEAERVLEPGAAAALDGDAEDGRLPLGLVVHQLADLR